MKGKFSTAFLVGGSIVRIIVMKRKNKTVKAKANAANRYSTALVTTATTNCGNRRITVHHTALVLTRKCHYQKEMC